MKKLNLLVIAVALVSVVSHAAEVIPNIRLIHNAQTMTFRSVGVKHVAEELVKAEYKVNPKEDTVILYSDNGIFGKIENVKTFDTCKSLENGIKQCERNNTDMQKMKAAFLKFGDYVKNYGATNVYELSTTELRMSGALK